MSWFWRRVAYLKLWFLGAGAYLGFINFILLLLTFKMTYHFDVSAWVIVIFGLVAVIGVGCFDYFLIMRHQNNLANDVNEYIMDIKKEVNVVNMRLERIEKLLEEKKNG